MNPENCHKSRFKQIAQGYAFETMGRNPGYQPSQAKNDELIIKFQNKWKKYSTRSFFPKNS